MPNAKAQASLRGLELFMLAREYTSVDAKLRLLFPCAHEFSVTRGNHVPRKILPLRKQAALHKGSTIMFVLQDTEQHVTEVAFPLRRNKRQPRLGYWRCRLRPLECNHWQTAGNPGNGTAPSRGNWPAYKEQNIGNR